jgi:hypothetical protein
MAGPPHRPQLIRVFDGWGTSPDPKGLEFSCLIGKQQAPRRFGRKQETWGFGQAEAWDFFGNPNGDFTVSIIKDKKE